MLGVADRFWIRRYGLAGLIDIEDLLEMERACLPGVGSCSAMFTANTMSSAVEAMGLSLPGMSHHWFQNNGGLSRSHTSLIATCAFEGTASHVAAASPEVYCQTINPVKVADAEESVKALMAMLKSGLRSRDIVTREAIENAVRWRI